MPQENLHVLFARIPEDLWESLREEAKQQNRSATAQLVQILSERYRVKTAEPDAPKRQKKS